MFAIDVKCWRSDLVKCQSTFDSSFHTLKTEFKIGFVLRITGHLAASHPKPYLCHLTTTLSEVKGQRVIILNWKLKVVSALNFNRLIIITILNFCETFTSEKPAQASISVRWKCWKNCWLEPSAVGSLVQTGLLKLWKPLKP